MMNYATDDLGKNQAVDTVTLLEINTELSRFSFRLTGFCGQHANSFMSVSMTLSLGIMPNKQNANHIGTFSKSFVFLGKFLKHSLISQK